MRHGVAKTALCRIQDLLTWSRIPVANRKIRSFAISVPQQWRSKPAVINITVPNCTEDDNVVRIWTKDSDSNMLNKIKQGVNATKNIQDLRFTLGSVSWH